MPKITVVTPSFNQARYLQRTIDSVLSQKVDLEYIIVDGCSTDGSIKILDEYLSKARVVVEKDEGQSDAIAKGFAMASGDILAWLNSDDMYLPGALNHVVAAYERGCEFFYGHVMIVDAEDVPLRKRVAIHADFNDLYYGGYIIPQEATFFSRRLYRESGGLDRSFHYAMDYDLWLRLAALQPPARIDHFISCFRYHGDQKSSRRPDLYAREIKRARSKSAAGHPSSILKSSTRKLALGVKKLVCNVAESGVRRTLTDVVNKKRGRLP